MNTARTYLLRQKILQTAAELAPAALGLDDLQCSLKLRTVRPSAEELNAQVNYLIVQGFLAAIPESAGEYFRASPSGLDQAGRETTPDPRIWGKDAL